jgi:DNA polymerase-4
MEKLTELPFNPKPSTLMHLDINSCFATIEQQANPQLRGKPIAVAAYDSPSGCILAASIEAKELGIKTGMRVKDGKLIYPKLIVLTPDPPKYRDVHLKIRRILKTYSDDVAPKSIDEFVINFEGYPAFELGMFNIGREIKQKIRDEVGEWIKVSIGISTNRFLAKTASNLKKPDGLEEINKENHIEVFSKLGLMDLCGIKKGNYSRLASSGIYTVLDFYNANIQKLKQAFQSVCGYHWYLRLHGWEIDDVEFERKSFGNSFALPIAFKNPQDLAPILYKLVEKTSRRLREAGFKANGVHLALNYKDGSFWHHGEVVKKGLFDSRDIFRQLFRILCHSPYKKPVSVIAESCFGLVPYDLSQLELFDDINKKKMLNKALDEVNDRWGEFAITPAKLLMAKDYVHDRIAFGGVKELTDF